MDTQWIYRETSYSDKAILFPGIFVGCHGLSLLLEAPGAPAFRMCPTTRTMLEVRPLTMGDACGARDD